MRSTLGISQNTSVQEVGGQFLSAEDKTGNQSQDRNISLDRVHRGQRIQRQGQGHKVMSREDSGVHLLTDHSTESVLDPDSVPLRSSSRSKSSTHLDSNMNHLQQAELQLVDLEEMTFDLQQRTVVMTSAQNHDTSYNEASLAEELANQEPAFKHDNSGSYFYRHTLSEGNPRHDSDSNQTDSEMEKNLKQDSMRNDVNDTMCIPVLNLPLDVKGSDSRVLNPSNASKETGMIGSQQNLNSALSSEGLCITNNSHDILVTSGMDVKSGVVSNVSNIDQKCQSPEPVIGEITCSLDEHSNNNQSDNTLTVHSTSPELHRGDSTNVIHVQSETIAFDNLSPYVVLRRDSADSFTSNMSMKTEMDSIECMTDI